MPYRFVLAGLSAVAVMAVSPSFAQSPAPSGVRTLTAPGMFKAEGTWSLGVRASF